VVSLARFLVDLAIELYNELVLVTVEVENIHGKGELAPKLEARQTAVSQGSPKLGLGRRLGFSQAASPLGTFSRHSRPAH
jgi:hypothetical protein